MRTGLNWHVIISQGEKKNRFQEIGNRSMTEGQLQTHIHREAAETMEQCCHGQIPQWWSLVGDW